jgi:hypothetical protein
MKRRENRDLRSSGYCATSNGNPPLTFRDNVPIPSSGVKKFKKENHGQQILADACAMLDLYQFAPSPLRKQPASKLVTSVHSFVFKEFTKMAPGKFLCSKKTPLLL